MPRKKLDDKFFMRWAEDVSKASTCAKIQVGAVLVKDRRVISLGYNGVPSNQTHCCDHFVEALDPNILGEEEFLKQHAKFSDEHELHSEQSCIIDALKRQQNLSDSTLYCTWSPCFACAKVILSVGIKKVVYKNTYKQESIDFLKNYTEVLHITESIARV